MDEEQDIYAIYGVEKPNEEPENTQTEDETDIPDEEELHEEELHEEEDPAVDTDEPGEVSDDQNREAAHQQELERVRQEGKEALNAQVKGMNLVDPYHGNKPITNVEELEAYKTADREAKIDRYCKAAGITREQFDELVGGLPEVRGAKDAQARAEAAEKAAQERQARERLDADLAQIRKLCPEIKNLDALVAHKSYDKVIARMKETGDGVLDAFKHVNFDELMTDREKNVRRQGVRNQRGKDHLKGSGGKGSGGVSVPGEVYREYKRYNPNATDEEIARHYARRHNK